MIQRRKISIGDKHIEIHDAGRMAYVPALELQRQLHDRVLADEIWGAVVMVEHDPVITISQRKSSAEHLLASHALLEKIGIDVQETDRGGDITYHGPGQLVAYPILRLGDLHLHVGGYMRLLEEIVIDTLKAWNIQGKTEQGATGVWVDEAASGGKICAMGVRVRRGVTMHGLALNVTTDLSHFDTIVPCGLAGRKVTSMARVLTSPPAESGILGRKNAVENLTMDCVKNKMMDVLREKLSGICEC